LLWMSLFPPSTNNGSAVHRSPPPHALLWNSGRHAAIVQQPANKYVCSISSKHP
jgi:hypothetical protein